MSRITVGTYNSSKKMKEFGFSDSEIEKYLAVFEKDADNFNSLVSLCSEMDLDLNESRKFVLRRTIEEHPLRYVSFFKPENYENVLSYAGII